MRPQRAPQPLAHDAKHAERVAAPLQERLHFGMLQNLLRVKVHWVDLYAIGLNPVRKRMGGNQRNAMPRLLQAYRQRDKRLNIPPTAKSGNSDMHGLFIRREPPNY
jgi:hypothetical protein